jgi:hypothetical protein
LGGPKLTLPVYHGYMSLYGIFVAWN